MIASDDCLQKIGLVLVEYYSPPLYLLNIRVNNGDSDQDYWDGGIDVHSIWMCPKLRTASQFPLVAFQTDHGTMVRCEHSHLMWQVSWGTLHRIRVNHARIVDKPRFLAGTALDKLSHT